MLTKRSNSGNIYLEVKHWSLWQPIKAHVPGCETIEVQNPKTKETVTKYGYRFDTVSGHATKLVKYDTERKYATRYFGFKLHLVDGLDTYVLDMPYASQFLRRFLRVAHNVDWSQPLSITVFKGKKKDKEGDELGVWFRQDEKTVKAFFTREDPHGMPPAVQDSMTHEWDFKEQHRFLIARLIEDIIPEITAAAQHRQPPVEPNPAPAEESGEPVYLGDPSISDDDVPF